MKTLEWAENSCKELCLSSDYDSQVVYNNIIESLVWFLPLEKWKDYDREISDEERYVPFEWTEKNIIDICLKTEVKFAISDIMNRNTDSTKHLYDFMVWWCKVLENGLDKIPYNKNGSEFFCSVNDFYHLGIS